MSVKHTNAHELWSVHYAPQIGCMMEEKYKFWTDLVEVVFSVQHRPKR